MSVNVRVRYCLDYTDTKSQSPGLFQNACDTMSVCLARSDSKSRGTRTFVTKPQGLIYFPQY